MADTTKKKRDPNLDDIDKALKEFPKVIKQKEEAHREKEKVMKPFMKLADELQRREKLKKSESESGDLPDEQESSHKGEQEK